MERRISVGIFRPKYVDHLQRWSQIFRSEETETNLSIWIPTDISGIFGIIESAQEDQLQRWSRIFRSEEKVRDLSIWIPESLPKWKAPLVSYAVAFWDITRARGAFRDISTCKDHAEGEAGVGGEGGVYLPQPPTSAKIKIYLKKYRS